MTFWQSFPIMLLSLNSMFLAWWISKLSGRLTNLEDALKMKDWIEAISSGESPPALANMFEKGYLK
jgi:hypothetical protein